MKAPPFAADTGLATDRLDRAVAGYLTRFTRSSREHARSDLRCFLGWCAYRHLQPLAARRRVLDHSPAEHARRPAVPPESPTLGVTHLQFEAMLTASRDSANPSDLALVAMLGLLGLRIFEATSANIADLGEEHGHRVLRVCGKGTTRVPQHVREGAGDAYAAGLRDVLEATVG